MCVLGMMGRCGAGPLVRLIVSHSHGVLSQLPCLCGPCSEPQSMRRAVKVWTG